MEEYSGKWHTVGIKNGEKKPFSLPPPQKKPKQQKKHQTYREQGKILSIRALEKPCSFYTDCNRTILKAIHDYCITH